MVAELRRDGAPETVELQALKYAADRRRFTPETLADQSPRAAHVHRRGARPAGSAPVGEVSGLHNAGSSPPRRTLLAGTSTGSTTAVAV